MSYLSRFLKHYIVKDLVWSSECLRHTFSIANVIGNLSLIYTKRKIMDTCKGRLYVGIGCLAYRILVDSIFSHCNKMYRKTVKNILNRTKSTILVDK